MVLSAILVGCLRPKLTLAVTHHVQLESEISSLFTVKRDGSATGETLQGLMETTHTVGFRVDRGKFRSCKSLGLKPIVSPKRQINEIAGFQEIDPIPEDMLTRDDEQRIYKLTYYEVPIAHGFSLIQRIGAHMMFDHYGVGIKDPEGHLWNASHFCRSLAWYDLCDILVRRSGWMVVSALPHEPNGGLSFSSGTVLLWIEWK